MVHMRTREVLMNRFFIILIAVFGLINSASPAAAEINVFACEPEWAALTKELGGDKVEVFSATTARQDPHYIRAKPSLIAAVRKADLIVCSGASLEIGWLPLLLQKSGSQNTQPGSNGYLLAADYVQTIEKPQRLDRSEGDVHPEGNPHLHLNPHNIARVAEELTKRLSSLESSNSSFFRQRFEQFLIRWNEALARWESRAKSLKGAWVVVHHKSLSHLIDWLGLQEVGSLEPKPGIPPSSAHLESLLLALKSMPPNFILRTPFDPADASSWLSEKTGSPAIILPYTVGGNDESVDLFTLFDSTLDLLTKVKGPHD